MIVIHFAEMNLTEHARINHGLGRQELAGEAQFKTNTGLHARLLHGFLEGAEIFERKAQRFFEDEMLAGSCRFDRLRHVLTGQAAKRHDVDVGIHQHRVEAVVNRDIAAVLRAQRRGVKRTRRTNGADLREGRSIDRGNVGRGRPAIANDADVELFHE